MVCWNFPDSSRTRDNQIHLIIALDYSYLSNAINPNYCLKPPFLSKQTDDSYNMCVSSEVLADFLDAPHEGPPTEVKDVNGVRFATNSELTFIRDDTDVDQVSAGAAIVPDSFDTKTDIALIRHQQPQIAFLKITEQFFVSYPDQTTVHPTATIENDAQIGEQCIIGPNVYIPANVTLGDRCVVESGAVIGADPKGFATDEKQQLLQHKFRGKTDIGNNVTIGSNTVIKRGIFGTTKVGDNCIVSDLVLVEHDSNIESRVWLSGNVTVAGNVTIKKDARINHGSNIAEKVTIGESTVIGMNSSVLEDVPENTTVAGTPASEI